MPARSHELGIDLVCKRAPEMRSSRLLPASYGKACTMMRPVSMAALRKGGTIALTAIVLLAGCGPSFQQMSEAECAGIATDTAYEACQRNLAQRLADERLGYIVRSQVVR
jgi:hypothetical protein